MRKLLIFVGGFAVAIGLLVYFLGGVNIPLILISACVTVPLFFFRKKWLRRMAVFALGLTFGFLWCSFYTGVMLRPADTVCGSATVFSARAVEYSTDVGSGRAVTVDLLLDKRNVRANLYYRDDVQIAPGNLVSGVAEFKRTAILRTDGADFYDISRGVYLTGSVIGEIRVQEDENISFRSTLRRLSRSLQENLRRAFPTDSAEYFVALTTGDRSGLPYSFRNRLAVTGLYHAVSLSGMHISVLVSALVLFCFKHKRLAAILGIPMVLLFCLMSGASPATMRAMCMQTVLLLTMFLNREYDSLTSLALALFLLLLGNPWSLTHWGLQLSFVSAAGILLLMPMFMRLTIRPRFLRTILMPMFVTLSATVFSAPLMSVYFGMNSLVAPITNLLALWSVTLSFVGGIAISLLGFVSLPIAQFLAVGFDVLYRWLYWVASVFSELPVASVYSEMPLLLAWSYLSYLLTVLALLLKVKWYVPMLCIAGTLLAALSFTPKLPDGVTVLDVGQGQSILLRSEDRAVLVDCGGEGNDTGETAARFLISHGIRRLDAVVITHFDADHCDGVSQLLDRIPTTALYYPTTEESTSEQEKILSSAACLLQPVTEVTPLGFSEMEVTLYPALGGKNDNDTGVCVLASCRECDILITGDLNTEAEARLITGYDFPDLEILVAGHHGSGTSTGPAILDRLRPETVLISVGENRYGHPSQQTLDRIAATGAAAYTTMDNGNLTVRW